MIKLYVLSVSIETDSAIIESAYGITFCNQVTPTGDYFIDLKTFCSKLSFYFRQYKFVYVAHIYFP